MRAIRQRNGDYGPMREERMRHRHVLLWLVFVCAGCDEISSISIEHAGAPYLNALLSAGVGNLDSEVTVSSDSDNPKVVNVTWSLLASDFVLQSSSQQVVAWKNNPSQSNFGISVPVIGGIYEIRACVGNNTEPYQCRQRFFTVAFPSGQHPLAPPVTFDVLEDLLSQNPIRTIDDMLSVLPQGYRDKYSLMTASGSLQSATPTSPRVILFGRPDDAVIAFNEQGSATGDQTVEMIEFDEATAAFEFRRITFPAPGVAGVPMFGPVNDPICMGCHFGPDPRPNWDAYSHWNNTYGVDLSTIHPLNDPVEAQNYDDYLEGTATILPATVRARYRHLTEYPRGADIGGYAPVFTGNDKLTEKFATGNFKRIARKIRSELEIDYAGQSYHWEDLKWGIVGTIACRNDSDAHFGYGGSTPPTFDFFPPGFDAQEIAMRQPGADWRRCSDSSLESDGSVLPYVPYDLPEAFEAFGLSTLDWSMEMAANGPRFTPDVFCFQPLLYALVDGDAELSAHFQAGRIDRSGGIGGRVAPGPYDYWKAVNLRGADLSEQHTHCAAMACASQTSLGGTCN